MCSRIVAIRSPVMRVARAAAMRPRRCVQDAFKMHSRLGAAMSANDYHFITNWRVQSTVEEVSEILGDAPDLARWWPSVYLEVQEIQPGDASGVGRVIALHTKGWLPYTIRWQFRVTESHFPHGFAIEAWGDFIGRGVWTFAQEGPDVAITYDWSIRADKALFRYGSFLLKPIFAANHRWAMRKGEESLKIELARRHATNPDVTALESAT
jgi:hypothetical protein